MVVDALLVTLSAAQRLEQTRTSGNSAFVEVPLGTSVFAKSVNTRKLAAAQTDDEHHLEDVSPFRPLCARVSNLWMKSTTI